MKKETHLLLKKAKRSLAAAHTLLEKGDYDFAASRGYYAMFYAAEAALLEVGKTFSKHTGVISGFYHEFVATDKVPQQLHQYLHEAFEDRGIGDYGFLEPFPKQDSEQILTHAEHFVVEMEKLVIHQDIR